MTINTSLANSGFEWSTPEATPNNTGHKVPVLFGQTLFLSIAACCAIWPDLLLTNHSASNCDGDGFNNPLFWGIVELLIGGATLSGAFSLHFRVDSVQADEKGLRIAYSHVQEFLGNYVNEKTTLDWGQIGSITEGEDGEGTYWICIDLSRPLLETNWELRLGCDGEAEMHHGCKVLQGLAPSRLYSAEKREN